MLGPRIKVASLLLNFFQVNRTCSIRTVPFLLFFKHSALIFNLLKLEGYRIYKYIDSLTLYILLTFLMVGAFIKALNNLVVIFQHFQSKLLICMETISFEPKTKWFFNK